MKPTRAALIIDDEKQIRRLLRLALEGADFQVYETETGQAGLSEIVHRRPDIVILDLGLPDMEGVKVLRRLREWSDVPVLILSVRDDAEEKVAALDAGADDYVTKPFDTAELLARVRAAQRRSLTETGEPAFSSGALCVDFSARQVKLGGIEIKLTRFCACSFRMPGRSSLIDSYSERFGEKKPRARHNTFAFMSRTCARNSKRATARPV
jgi:two-component system KDP operon response regulator KdpE